MNVSKRTFVSAAVKVSAFLPLCSAIAATAPPAVEQSIPFVNYGGIQDWKADKDRGLWIRDNHRKWFYASVMGPCPGLNFAHSLAFDARPVGTFDRFSAVIIPGWGRCQVQSLLPSEGPPKASKKSAKPAAPAPAPEQPQE